MTMTSAKTSAKTTSTKARIRLDTRPRPEARPGRARGRTAVLDAPRQDRTRSAAAQRGYARKAQRQAAAGTGPRIRAARRTPFVLLVMALLATGLITSLWLSTAAAGDSYRLDGDRREARDLTERAEQLRQEVAAMQTAPQLAQRARDLGMVLVDEPARLVRQSDGTVVVIGKPAPATPAPPVGHGQPSGQQPSDQQPSGQQSSDQQSSGQQSSDQPPSDQPPSDQQPSGQPPSAQQPSGQQPPAQQPPAGGG
jgi:hypothetical protein